MPIESATYISDLNPDNPVGNADTKATLDDHIRLHKLVTQNTWPNISGAVTPTHTELNYVDGVTSAIQTQLDAKAPLASPTLTGTPAAPTAAPGTATTQIATTAFVDAKAFSSALPSQTGNGAKFVTTDGTNASWSLVPLTTGVSGTLPVANGGTGVATITGIVKGSGTGAFSAAVADTDYQSALVSGTSIKTVNSNSLLGAGDIAIGSGLTLLATLTPTAAAQVNALSTFTSSYDNYLIIGQALTPASAGPMMMRFATGGAIDSGSNYYASAVSASFTTSATYFDVSTSNVSNGGKGLDFRIDILNVNDATSSGKVIATHAIWATAATTFAWADRMGMYIAANTVSGVSFSWVGGMNFAAAGSIRIYGYNNT